MKIDPKLSAVVSLLPAFSPLLLAIPADAQPAKPAVKLAPVTRRAGNIVGRAIKENGSPVPSFTVAYSGFEDGKLANYSYGGGLYETINSTLKASGGKYAVKVPPGAYRASAYVTYRYLGRVYNCPMEMLGAEPNYDYKSLQLEKLRKGLIRNFVLKMTGKRKGASEDTETVYRFAYYGGSVKLYADEYDAVFGTGKEPSKPLRYAYPPDSRVLLTLTPAGTRVDGSKNYPVNADLPLGDDGKWTFMVRGIFPGRYTATAKLRLPDGTIKPLRLATKPADVNFTAGPDGSSGRRIFNRTSSVLVDFLPNDLGPIPRMGVNEVKLYLGD